MNCTMDDVRIFEGNKSKLKPLLALAIPKSATTLLVEDL